MALVVAIYSVYLFRFLGFDQFVPFSWIVFCIECGIVRLATISVFFFLVLLGSHLSSSLVFGFCVIMDGALLGGREGENTNNKWKCNPGWWVGFDLGWRVGQAHPCATNYWTKFGSNFIPLVMFLKILVRYRLVQLVRFY